ncbi:MAG: hypothetical protein MZU79_09120 [Anaerotruncus sp.]|nr:hypothetical protein [Anaerotruncus sp.]
MCSLFERINRKITLTDAGKVFFEYSEKLLNLIEEVNAVMNEFSTGDVGMLALLVPPARWGSTCSPGTSGSSRISILKAEIALMIQNRQEALEHCIAGEMDFAFIQDPQAPGPGVGIFHEGRTGRRVLLQSTTGRTGNTSP